MFLRSLTLKGFKSFAEPTTIEFEPGLTAVVGPNGSGKSNVVDAVAWVLGAQGPRTMRSNRMDDVIFAGTGRRPALGRAEVSLTIDNSSGLLPIQFSELTITRTLFRSSGESEYSLNGAPCRLLDLQELLSDTGVGRQQHVIVSQGNLDSILDARPSERRLIVEEAAGILKFRRRKEKAERRLEATEANLVRATDLLREVSRQIRPLERQAEAARRHGELAAEMRALRLFLAGRELSALAARCDAATALGSRQVAEESSLKAELSRGDAAVAATEAWLARSERNSVGHLVGGLEALRERARGLSAVLAERGRSLERQRDMATDRAVGSVLEEEAERLDTELADVEAAEVALVPQREELERAEGLSAAERAGLAAPPPALNQAAEARGELGALRDSVDRNRHELVRLRERAEAFGPRQARLDQDQAIGAQVLEEATHRHAARAEAVAAAEVAQAVAAASAASLEVAARHAENRRRAGEARVDALAVAVRERGADDDSLGALAARTGVLGRLGRLVEVEPGWEAAVEAAAAGPLGAVLVDRPDRARSLLEEQGATATGPALLALGVHLPPPRPGHLPARPLRELVHTADPAVGALLDGLLAGSVVVDGGWREALDLAVANPQLVVVSRAGDCFSPRGWQVGGRGPEAARLALTTAEEEAAEARRAEAEAVSAARTAGNAAAVAAAAVERLVRERDVAASGVRAAATAAQGMEAERRELSAEVEGLRSHSDHLEVRLQQEMHRLAGLEASLPGLEAADAQARRAVAEHQERVARLSERAELLRRSRTEVEVRMAELAERRRAVSRRLTEVGERRRRLDVEEQAARARSGQLAVLVARTARLRGYLGERMASLEGALEDMVERALRQAEATRLAASELDELRRRRQGLERRLEEAREHRRRSELDEAEARMRIEAATEVLRRELDCEPDAALSAECPSLPAGSSAPSRRRELERELRLLGPVNPLALEELTALQERHVFLTAQLDDVKTTRRQLAKVIRGIEEEMTVLLAAALADVTDHFSRLFETLFPGGQGRVRLSEGDRLLDAGIELEARPAGKNVRRLSLLSGGERSLVALAFLFAVFRSRPSPFYMLDEVEAALDDVNLHRFLALLDEFRDEAQLVVVTHQKRTMEAADCLYGVTMQAGGSSKVVSERARAPA
ncbi:MAG: chromosome segregation protein SMC [Acidimicrobiales bacterium]